MTAGLGCGAVVLPFGQGRNDWLYNISLDHGSCYLILCLLFFLCPNRVAPI